MIPRAPRFLFPWIGRDAAYRARRGVTRSPGRSESGEALRVALGYTGPRLSSGVVDRVRGDSQPVGGTRSDLAVCPGQAAAGIPDQTKPGGAFGVSGGEESDASEVEMAVRARRGAPGDGGGSARAGRGAGRDAVVFRASDWIGIGAVRVECGGCERVRGDDDRRGAGEFPSLSEQRGGSGIEEQRTVEDRGEEFGWSADRGHSGGGHLLAVQRWDGGAGIQRGGR